MDLENVTLSDIGISSVSSTFNNFSDFIQVSIDLLTQFTWSIVYWILLIAVILIALAMVFLFFWVYYKGVMAILYILPKIEGVIEWIDYNLIEKLKQVSDGKREPEPEQYAEPEYEYTSRDRKEKR